MSDTCFSAGPRARDRRPAFRTHRLGRLAAPLLVVLLVLGLAPALAQADSPSTLTVVGTSDVSDSGLMSNVLQPAFEQAYPQFSFKYIGTATGTAISNAESGSVGASALIVHAASLENQFVAGGYSHEQYGRAIFTNDFVLAGATGDPAGVAANGANNVAQAFADVALTGAAGKATFVSRGGTPGTTVEEHKLWATVLSANLAPSSLLLCTINATSGGGDTPIASGHGVAASGQPCPNNGALPTASQLPSWYVATGLTQGPNVVAANSCNLPNGGCYVLTDRSTYDYLASGIDPAGSIPNLKIVTRDDSASAPGGADALINYFHDYTINPSKPGETVNLTAAQDWANFLTLPSTQAAVGQYLSHTSDPGGAPFKPDASPILSPPAGLPAAYHAGRPVTLTGTVTNAETGFPALGQVKVTLSQLIGNLPVPVASGLTNLTGAYRIRFTPSSSGRYAVSTPPIAKIEDSTLNPVFGDLLSPAVSTPAQVTVHGTVTDLRVEAVAGRALVLGSVAPGFTHADGTVTISARRSGRGGYHTVAVDRLASGDGNFAVDLPLAAARWQFRARFQDPGRLVASRARSVRGTVGARPTTIVSRFSVRLDRGRITARARLSRAVGARRASVVLLALRTSGTGARYIPVGHASVRRGARSATIHASLRRGFRWALVLESVAPGQASAYSAQLTVNVR
ncbi:MAG: hypothetical protein M3022_03430 [Actinomycetota bacterium]|nr:hypothetical protein [Actinomycetota bacterium]